MNSTYFDLQVGAVKGVYHFGKGTVEGVIDLAKVGWKVLTDRATQQKVVEGAVGLAEDYAKLQFGSMEQRQEVAQRAWNKTAQIAQAVKEQMASQWEKAKHNGKEAELLADWGTRGVLEVASMFVGLGELKVAAKTPAAAAAIAKVEQKVAEAGKLAKAGEVAGEAKKLGQKVGEVVQECPVVKSPPELKVELAKEAIPHRFSGARELKFDDYSGAERVYNEIRQSSTDVKAISRNTGISESRIARIKDHIFYRTHQLDDGIRHFDADPEIANAWQRLESGAHTQKDIQLLEHEIFESKFEGIFKTDYRTAHGAANRSGRLSGLE